MKVLLYDSWIHEKNKNGFKLMCDSIKADFIVSNKTDIIFIPSELIDPNFFPNVKHIIYGPHCFLFPTPPWLKNSCQFPPHCKYILPSKWTKSYVEETGGLSLPIIVNPFAVDVEKFKPDTKIKEYDCFIYFKHRHPSLLESVLNEVKKRNLNYVTFVYGKYNEERLTGLHETSTLDKCTWGYSDRGKSIRIPLQVVENKRGYLEDRRPASNCDPYLVSERMLETVYSETEAES